MNFFFKFSEKNKQPNEAGKLENAGRRLARKKKREEATLERKYRGKISGYVNV